MAADELRDRLQTTLGSAYTIERELGGGGMSRVFVATDDSLGRHIVIKVLPPDTAAGVSVERFKREIQLAARLQHPHIVPLLSTGASDGLPFFTMPFVEGESLRVRLARRGELPVAEAIRVLREIASALAYAHERGIVHRDIKPDNVLLSGGAAMVTDFGVAKALSSSSNAEHGGVTSLGVALGTPAYMSPEQASADPAVDHRADVYAFGVLAYELLTGQTPFGGRTPQGLLAAHVSEPPEPIQKRRPSLPPALAALVMRCLEKRPADRPQSAAEIVHVLDDLTTPSGGMQPTSALPVTSSGAAAPARDPTASAGRRRVPVIIGAGVLLVLIAGGALAWTRRHSSPTGADGLPRAIAVLRFQNVGGDTATQFFTDGMTDELTSVVAGLPGLRVESRSATDAAVKAAAGDDGAIGQRLGVGALLEGSVRRAGNRMRLTAQLTDVHDGAILWSETYDREVKDAFAVQDEVARAIASALRVKLAGSGEARAAHTTTSPEVHDLYLRGRYLQAKYTEPDLHKSIELFEEAVAKDSTFVPAWAGIAESWAMLADDFVAPTVALPHIHEAVARGLAIDSTTPELRLVRGTIALWYDRDAYRAVQLMAPAVSRAGEMPGAVQYYAIALWLTGQRDSAAAFVRAAVARDPASPDVLSQAHGYFALVDSSAAAEYCHRLDELGAAHICNLGRAQADSMLAFERGQVSGPDLRTRIFAYGYVARALMVLGRDAEAKAVARQLDSLASSGGRYVNVGVVADTWAEVGDKSKVFEWLERGLASNASVLGDLYYEFYQRRLIRSDPRLMALAKKAGLPPPPPYFLERQ